MRSFGFIDFKTVDEAIDYMEYTRGTLQFENGFESRIEYARENDPNYVADKKAHGSSDWFCAKVCMRLMNLINICRTFSVQLTISTEGLLASNVERLERNPTV
jgi:hypothetical protein